VHHLHGPCLVLAGAGSGKTRVIVHKIARLLQAGLGPKQIAAITFTNKAAQEMRERAKALVGAARRQGPGGQHLPQPGRAHAAHRRQRVGLKPNFSILDSDDVLGVLRDAGGCTDNALARRWQWTISLWKNQGLDADAAEAAASNDDERVAARVMRLFEERLQAYQAVDFDDLIGLPLKLLQRDEEGACKLAAQFRHVLVDEYQDTNAVQYDLLKLLAGDDPRGTPFTAVGDDDQSIYGWRGATIDNLKRLPQDYPQLKVIPLEQNYRSTGHILRAANAVIAAQPQALREEAVERPGRRRPGARVECDGEEHEAERAVARIQSLRGRAGQPARQRAEVQRLRHPLPRQPPGRVFEQKLRAAQIPYKVSGGQSFFDRAEIKDLCAWLRLLVNQDDDPAFLRAVTTPKRGIGHQTLGSAGRVCRAVEGEPVRGAVFAQPARVLKGKAIESLHEFGREVNELEHRARHTTGSRRRQGAAAGLAEGHRLRAAPVRQRRQREARRRALVQCAGLRRLDRAPLRRRDHAGRRQPSKANARACCRWRRPSASSSAWPSAATSRTW
jgi:ATP-dependent DNA helicase Rep